MQRVLKSRSSALFTLLNFFLAAIICIGLGKLVLDLFPVRIHVIADKSHATIQVGKDLQEIALSSPINQLYFPPLEKYRREFLMDGSDGVTYNNFDSEYFATFSATPYYQFQSFLRNENSYASFRNLEVRDHTGTRIVRQSHPPDATTIKLPQTFSLSVDLLRPELTRFIEFDHTDKSITKLTIDRNGKHITIANITPDNQSKDLAKWYFPTDPLPFYAALFYTVSNALALSFVLLAGIPLLAMLMPKKRIAFPKKKVAGALILLSLSTLLCMGWYASVFLFDKSPYILDSMSYYFQGKIFAQGLWTAPTPFLKEAFPNVFVVTHNDNWFSIFPPGTALVLALGFFLHIPWLIQTVLAVLSGMLIYLVGKKLYGKTVGVISLVLFAGSPFVHLQAASFLSHMPALFFALLSFYLLLRYLDQPRKRYLILACAAFGFTMLVRELTFIIYLVTGGLFVLWSAIKKYGLIHIRWHLALSVILLSGAVLVYLAAYHYGYTGSFLQPPRLSGDPHDHWGFGKGVGFFGAHTLASGLVNTDQLLTSLTINLFGWPYYFALAFLFIPFITRKATKADILSLTIILSTVLFYVGYYYHSIALGPRHYFEALPAFVFLTARGLVILAESTIASRIQSIYAVVLLYLILLSCNLFYFEPRLFTVYRNFSNISGGQDLDVTSFLHMTVEGRSANLTNSVIISDNWQIYNTYLGYLNCPRLNCSTIYALATTEEARQKLFQAYPGRYFYDAVRVGDKLILKKISLAP